MENVSIHNKLCKTPFFKEIEILSPGQNIWYYPYVDKITIFIFSSNNHSVYYDNLNY